MFERIKRILGGEAPGGSDAPAGGPVPTRDIRVATCALFLEMAKVDGEFDEAEREHIVGILQREYGLSDDYILELEQASKAEIEKSIDLWQFTNIINQNYSDEDKVRVVELLWRIVYADGKLDAHERYLVRKIGSLLRLRHDQIIEAKLRVLHGGE